MKETIQFVMWQMIQITKHQINNLPEGNLYLVF